MSEGPKRIRSIDSARTVRPDPRVDPATMPPPPDSSVEPHSSSDIPVAQFRHKVAALQAQLADVQRLLADEQRERAEDADQLARMLKHVSNAEARVREAETRAENRALGAARELADERDISQQLGKSLTRKEEDCVALRGQVLDLEQKLDELDATKERLIEVQASEGELKRQLLDAIAEVAALQTAKEELARAEHARDENLKDATLKAQEIERLTNQLKQANMKAFTANRQHESWKVESQRTIDQLRKDHEEKTASLSKELRDAEATRRDLRELRARAESMRQHMEASIKILTLTSEALEAAETTDSEIQKLRAAHEAQRRQVLEQALGVRNALKRAAEEPPTIEVSEADWSDDEDDGK